MSPAVAGLVLQVVFGALFAGALASPALAALYVLASFLFALVIWVATIVCAFKDGNPGWGIVTIIPVINIFSLYYVFFVSERAYIKVTWLVSIGFGVLQMIFGVQLAEQLHALQ
jgi:hypothetical protein